MALLPALVLTLAAAQDPQTAQRLVVEPARIEVQVDSARALVARLGGNAATDVVWASVDASIATVDAQGLVRGVAPGRTRIAVRVGAAVVFADIVVPDLPAATIDARLDDAAIPAGTASPYSCLSSTDSATESERILNF